MRDLVIAKLAGFIATSDGYGIPREFDCDEEDAIKDPAELIYKRARIMDKRNEFDQATRQLYENKGFRSLSALQKDKTYQALLKAYEKDLDNVYNEKADFSAARVSRKGSTVEHPKDIQDIIKRNTKPKEGNIPIAKGFNKYW